MNLNSLSLFVGTGECNARCKHCAGVPLRKYAPDRDGSIDEELVMKTARDCYAQGARYLSISSSGEPTLSPLSVTKTLELINDANGVEFSPINLYSNGIRIGKDEYFCDEYLSRWRDLGLTTVYTTVHDTNEGRNAEVYGVDNYPSLDLIFSRIHEAGLLVRANLVLSRKNIGTCDRFTSMINSLKGKGADLISAWPIRNLEDEVDLEMSPSKTELDKMEDWIEKNSDIGVRLLREKDMVSYKEVRKLTLFPNGVLSNSWCN